MDEELLAFMKEFPRPQKESFQCSFVCCHDEKCCTPRIVRWLVHLVIGLRAARLLAEHGFVRELGPCSTYLMK